MKLRKTSFFASLMGLLMVFAITGCDPCSSVDCLNGGTCLEGDCVCAAGYEGTDCSVLSRAKMVGSYNAAETCGGNNFTYACDITASAQNDVTILFSNFYDLLGFYGVSEKVTATVNGEDSFLIPNQTITNGGDTYTASGSGTFNASDNSISLTYEVTVNGTTDNCTATYTLQ